MIKNKYLFIVLIVFLSSCKVLKNTSNDSISDTKHKKLEKLIEKNKFKFDDFSSKVRVIYNKQNFTAHLRMKKDSIIWISLTGPFGIEGARIKITPSRFEMIDRLNREYHNKALSYIRNYFPVELDYSMIESLITGNFLEKSIKKQKIETKGGEYFVEGDIDNLTTNYSLSAYGRLINIDIKDKNSIFGLNIDFTNYEIVDNQTFSLRRLFSIKKLEDENVLDLKFYKIQIEKNKYPFKVPKEYAIK